jgi:uncharacterized membrane protein
LVLGLIFGLALVVVVPPFEGADEFTHFARAFQVSEGRLIAEQVDRRVGGFVPRSAAVTMQNVLDGIPFHPEKKHDPRVVLSLFALPLGPADRIFVDFATSALTPPLTYSPQALAFAVGGGLLNLSPLMLLYLGRLANLVSGCMLMHAAVRHVPFAPWLLVALALTPMALFQTSTLSPDASTNGLALLWVALCLRHAIAPGLMTTARILGLIALGVLVALSKVPYAALLPLWFAIPPKRFGSHARFLGATAVLIVGAGTLALGWALSARNLTLSYDAYNPASRDRVALVRDADPDRQLAIMVAQPGEFIGVLARSLRRNAYFLAYSFVGQLGWDVFLPIWHVHIHLVLLLVLALAGAGGGMPIRWPARFLLAGVAVVGFGVVASLYYVVWTPVGASFVNGVHGRHLIPLVAPVLLAITPSRQGGAAFFTWAVPIVSAVSLGFVLLALAARYYG